MDTETIPKSDWGAALGALCAADPELATVTSGRSCCFAWSIAGGRWEVRLSDGEASIRDAPARAGDGDGVQFELLASDEVWDAYLRSTPPAGRHDPMPMWLGGDMRIEGDVAAYVRNLGAVRRVFELARRVTEQSRRSEDTDAGRPPAQEAPSRVGELEPIVGRYVWLNALGRAYRVYFEEAGSGPPVLLLHTAAADGRQYRRLLTDPDYHGLRMIAVDLPYHGRSLPATDWWREPFQLTQALYAEVIESFIDALGLERPALVGASMASQIVLELLSRRPAAYRSIAAIGAVDHVGGAPSPWLRHPELNETEVVPNWVAGMTAPQVPEHRRNEIRWVYSQSAAGVFVGDAHFFQEEWDIRDRLASLDVSQCTLRLFAGEYDYSRPPHRVKATADQIPGAGFTALGGCGHFPMVEDPEQLKVHLLPLLATE